MESLAIERMNSDESQNNILMSIEILQSIRQLNRKSDTMGKMIKEVRDHQKYIA